MINRKSAEAYIVFVGTGKFIIQVFLFQRKLPEYLSFFNNLFNDLISYFINITNLDKAVF